MEFPERYRMICWMADRFVNSPGYQHFDKEELVDEAWLSKYVRNADDSGSLFSAVRFAIMFYKASFRKFGGKRRRFLNRRSLDGLELSYTDNTVEAEDEVKWLRSKIRNLTNREKIVINSTLKGNSLKVTGKLMGISGERARQIRVGAFTKIRNSKI